MGPNSLVTLSGDKLPTQPFNNEGHFRGAHLAVAFLGVCLFFHSQSVLLIPQHTLNLDFQSAIEYGFYVILSIHVF